MTQPTAITIRPAYPDDDDALVRLAALDSAEAIPPKPLLLAEIGTEVRAALSLQDGSSIADPFFPTLDALALLELHAAAGERKRIRRRRTLRYLPRFA